MNNIVYLKNKPKKTIDIHHSIVKLLMDNYPVDKNQETDLSNLYHRHEHEVYVSHLVYELLMDVENDRLRNRIT